MPSLAAQPNACSGPARFAASEVAFALGWEVHAPGLGGWTVQVDSDEEGEFVIVDPPLVYGDGFVVRPEGEEAVIVTPVGTSYRAPSLRDAMLLICPLSPDALAAVESLAAAPEY